ncbi:MAG TPA: tetratricopeptide repeat protein [Candidatus Angelobacter sp.]|nr:tetratricopeptide repeat protein [Candidatus Angelobacter sp.]
MNINQPFAYPCRRFVVYVVLFIAGSLLHAQTDAGAKPQEPEKPASRFIVQKDYDELRRSAGRVKAEDLPALQQKASAGDVQTQLLLGMLYQSGCGVVKRDSTLELNWYHKAADQGNSLAENQIGSYYDNGAGHNQAEGFKWYRKAADHGDAVAENNVGSMYAEGAGVQKNFAEATSWIRKAVEHGADNAMEELMALYDSGKAVPGKSLQENQQEGLTLLRSWADQGKPAAQLLLAAGYTNGSMGLSRNLPEAVNLLRKVAEKDAAAEDYLGWAYSHGEGVPRNDDEAFNWYRKSAEHGNAMGQANLGFMYENGRGVHKDLAEAAKLFQAAAEQGEGSAQYHLAELYEDGKSVSKDKITAIMWFILAKEAGGRDFMRELHPTTKYSGFSFYRHPYVKDYEEAERRAKAWKEIRRCR